MSLIYPNTKQDEKKSTDAEFMKYAKIEMVKAPQTVLLLGSGGRECAMAAAIAESKLLRKLYIAPGNAGPLLMVPMSLSSIPPSMRR